MRNDRVPHSRTRSGQDSSEYMPSEVSVLSNKIAVGSPVTSNAALIQDHPNSTIAVLESLCKLYQTTASVAEEALEKVKKLEQKVGELECSIKSLGIS